MERMHWRSAEEKYIHLKICFCRIGYSNKRTTKKSGMKIMKVKILETILIISPTCSFNHCYPSKDLVLISFALTNIHLLTLKSKLFKKGIRRQANIV